MSLDAEVWALVDSVHRDQVSKLSDMGVHVDIIVRHNGALLVRVSSGERYFNTGYPQGHWPSIHEDIEAMMSVFSDVYYTSDHTEYDPRDHSVWTVDKSAQLWKLWEEVKRG